MARKGTKHSDIEIKRNETAFEIVKETIATGSSLHFHSFLEAELVVEAEAPYKHDIELCESFLAEEKVEEVAEETEEVGGEY